MTKTPQVPQLLKTLSDAAPTSCAFPGIRPPVDVPMVEIPEPSCGYFADRPSLTRAFAVTRMPGELYHDFMDAGFRRSGHIFYQPICRGCRACVQIRVPVDSFQPSKSQRRVWRKNADLTVKVGQPEPTDEKFELYRRYLSLRHLDGRMERTRESFEEFLYDSPVETVECEYRDSQGQLVAVGICDVCSRSVSSVYFYFDPDQSRRSPGIFGALFEIDFAQRLEIPYYYLGYWISRCQAMEYKADFLPCELLGPDGVWRRKGEPQNPVAENRGEAELPSI